MLFKTQLKDSHLVGRPACTGACLYTLAFYWLIQSIDVYADKIAFKTKAPRTFPATKLESFLAAAGVGQIAAPEAFQPMGIGWLRKQASWAALNPSPGVYVWDDIDDYVMDANAGGLKVLLMIRDTPDWARVTAPYAFDSEGIHWAVTPIVEQTSGFAESYLIERTDPDTGQPAPDYPDDPMLMDSAGQLRLAVSTDFVTFVDALVGRYSATPFNVRHYQIANEHRPEANQYPMDGVADVASRWFVPAATHIHANYPGVKVLVCWPTNVRDAQLDEFDAVPGVLENLDIFARHYGTDDRLPGMWDRYAALGIPNISFWATEFGSVTTTNNPWKVVHDYPTIFALALQHEWADVDKFKLFWWPFTGHADPPKALTWQSDFALTPHGEQIRTLYALLWSTEELYEQFSASPDPSETDYISGFQTATGIVFAVGLEDWNGDGEIELDLTALSPADITTVRVVDPFGEIVATPAPVANGTGGTSLIVDLNALINAERAFYIDVIASIASPGPPVVQVPALPHTLMAVAFALIASAVCYVLEIGSTKRVPVGAGCGSKTAAA